MATLCSRSLAAGPRRSIAPAARARLTLEFAAEVGRGGLLRRVWVTAQAAARFTGAAWPAEASPGVGYVIRLVSMNSSIAACSIRRVLLLSGLGRIPTNGMFALYTNS